jgi:uncharacterized membrane protein
MRAMELKTLFGHLHPTLVHFPIVTLLLSVVFEWIALARRGPTYGPATRGLLISGLVIGTLALLSGLTLEGEFSFEGDEAAEALIERHEILGYIGMSATLLAVILGEIYRRAPARGRKIAYLVVLHVAAGSIAAGAAAGGALVWGPDWLPL